MDISGEGVLFLVLCISCLVFLKWRTRHEKGKLPPGPTPLPILGNMLQLDSREVPKSMMALYKKYGPVFTIYMGLRRVVVICGYDAVKEALITRSEDFSERGDLPSFDKVFRKHGVAFSNGETWKQLRRFTLSTLRDFGFGKRSIENRVQEEAKCLVEEFRKKKEMPFDPTFFFSQATSNVICSIVFGNRFDYEDKEFLTLLQMINESFQLSSSFWGQMYTSYTNIMDYLPGPHNKIFQCLQNLADFIKEKVKQNQETLDPDNLRDFIDCFLIKMQQLYKKYGPVFTIYMGLRRVVVICGYDAVKEALITRSEDFSERGDLPSFDKVFRKHGVAFSNGETWKQLRRFTLSTLRDFGFGKRSIENRVQEEAKCLVEEFRKKKEMPFDPTFFFSQATSNVICSIVFGNRFDYEDKEFLTLLQMINESFQLSSSFWGQMYTSYTNIMDYLPGPHNKIFQCLQNLADFIKEKVKQNQETLDPDNLRDFIDCFLIKMQQEKQNPVSEFHMLNLIFTTLSLFFGGTETTSTTLRYGFLILLKHPQITEKIQKEIDLVIGQNRDPSMEDRKKMPYTDAVVHEIQRFSDLLPLGVPHTVAQDTQFRGYTIPKNTDVYPMLTSVLWDPKHFKDPKTFNPGNFLDENGDFKKNDAFMPFSAGKRICLGEGLARTELFLLLTNILQNFTLKTTKDPKDIDISPLFGALGNLPRPYELCLVPR
ncbi:cytochrome P450 2G1 [Microcaecilia unicolor]|uniref:Cytochrome P450 2G1-like n=1 Tax=Microcaecilia unicolor TaxID=1415580 RepID=A0A6P7Z936_9AMPH|nr:cytochrome P450 2G1-like [Microcaecilia unicolor]